MSVPGEFRIQVVGLTWAPTYPDNIYALNEIAKSDDDTMEPLPVILIRNPANEHDPNAIEVHVPSLGDQGKIGHVPASVASRLAPCLDNGEVWTSEIFKVAIHPDHPANPGIHILIQRIMGGPEPF